MYTPEDIKNGARKILSNIRWFSQYAIERPLYGYQREVANALLDSVIFARAREFAILFPRQAGKNETQSQIEAYLLNLYRRVRGAQIVKAQPTFHPQAVNAMMRLERALNNEWNKHDWRKREGYLFQLGQAVITFFSAEPHAQAVGATASLLLEGDEAQDILESEWGRKFEPMMASTNATMVLWGTAWTSQTLLAKTIKRLRALELTDHVQRVFVVTPERVAKENPAYGAFVARQVAKYGRNHPLVKTQYYNEEIDAEGGMFPPARRALMHGSHPRRTAPLAGAPHPVAFLIDVAGEDEGATGDTATAAALAALENPERDATHLTIVEVDTSTLADPLIAAPSYRAVDRRAWIGAKHTTLYAAIRSLALDWKPRYIVVDATGVGAGLASFLSATFPLLTIPFIFNSATKSDLGWKFLAIVETGRWKDWAVPDPDFAMAKSSNLQSPISDPESATFWRELEFIQYQAGHNQTLRWGAPPGTRDPATGELVHDDTVISAALSALLDQQDWALTGIPMAILPGRDPLQDIDRGR